MAQQQHAARLGRKLDAAIIQGLEARVRLVHVGGDVLRILPADLEDRPLEGALQLDRLLLV
eukprot:12956837-Alexandrium_andersonii.AAC.1